MAETKLSLLREGSLAWRREDHLLGDHRSESRVWLLVGLERRIKANSRCYNKVDFSLEDTF